MSTSGFALRSNRIREAVAGTLVTSGLAGLFALSAMSLELTVADADLTPTLTLLGALIALAVGIGMFRKVAIEHASYREIVTGLDGLERRGIELLRASLRFSDLEEMPQVQKEINAWREDTLSYVQATCPEWTAPFHLPKQTPIHVHASHAGGYALASQVAGTLERISELRGQLHEA